MGSVYRTVADKLKLLQLAKRGSVTRACETTGFSRDSYYRLRLLYERRGKAGLEPMSRHRPLPTNRIAPAIEDAVLMLAREKPWWGRAPVAKELARHHLRISPAGVRYVWLRHRLTTRRLRGFLERQVHAVRSEGGRVIRPARARTDRRWTPQARAEVKRRVAAREPSTRKPVE
jgi:Winged helix-turn helix